MQALGKIRVVVVDVDALGPGAGEGALALMGRLLEPDASERCLGAGRIHDTGVAQVLLTVERWHLSRSRAGVAPHRGHHARAAAIDQRVDGSGDKTPRERIGVALDVIARLPVSPAGSTAGARSAVPMR